MTKVFGAFLVPGNRLLGVYTTKELATEFGETYLDNQRPGFTNMLASISVKELTVKDKLD